MKNLRGWGGAHGNERQRFSTGDPKMTDLNSVVDYGYFPGLKGVPESTKL